jgi:hypothetical protein
MQYYSTMLSSMKLLAPWLSVFTPWQGGVTLERMLVGAGIHP